MSSLLRCLVLLAFVFLPLRPVMAQTTDQARLFLEELQPHIAAFQSTQRMWLVMLESDNRFVEYTGGQRSLDDLKATLGDLQNRMAQEAQRNRAALGRLRPGSTALTRTHRDLLSQIRGHANILLDGVDEFITDQRAMITAFEQSDNDMLSRLGNKAISRRLAYTRGGLAYGAAIAATIQPGSLGSSKAQADLAFMRSDIAFLEQEEASLNPNWDRTDTQFSAAYLGALADADAELSRAEAQLERTRAADYKAANQTAFDGFLDAAGEALALRREMLALNHRYAAHNWAADGTLQDSDDAIWPELDRETADLTERISQVDVLITDLAARALSRKQTD